MRFLDEGSHPLDGATRDVLRPPDPLDGQDGVLERGEPREEGRQLERPGDSQRGASIRWIARDVLAAEGDGPAVGRDLSREDLEQGGLSGAVRAQDRLSAALANIQVDPRESLQASVPLAHAGYLQAGLIAHLGPPLG